MITINQIETRKLEINWETGEDYQFLKTVGRIIEQRNKDKEEISKLKEGLI